MLVSIEMVFEGLLALNLRVEKDTFAIDIIRFK